jgi:hypothetical protein
MMAKASCLGTSVSTEWQLVANSAYTRRVAGVVTPRGAARQPLADLRERRGRGYVDLEHPDRAIPRHGDRERNGVWRCYTPTGLQHRGWRSGFVVRRRWPR